MWLDPLYEVISTNRVRKIRHVRNVVKRMLAGTLPGQRGLGYISKVAAIATMPRTVASVDRNAMMTGEATDLAGIRLNVLSLD